MGILFTNNAVTKLATAITSTSSTTVVVSGGTGSLFPSPGVGDWFMIVVENPLTNPITREIMQVTARTNDTLTVVRAAENTTAATFPSGANVAHRLTAGSLAQVAIPAPPPTYGTVVATGANQAGAASVVYTGTVITGGASGTGVIMPAVVGERSIWNRSGSMKLIYPASGVQFEALGANNPVQVANNSRVTILHVSTTQGYVG